MSGNTARTRRIIADSLACSDFYEAAHRGAHKRKHKKIAPEGRLRLDKRCELEHFTLEMPLIVPFMHMHLTNGIRPEEPMREAEK